MTYAPTANRKDNRTLAIMLGYYITYRIVTKRDTGY